MNSQAYWIAPAGIAADNENVYFRAIREFSLAEVPQQQMLRITCEGYYRLEINGQYVALGPARGSKTIAFVDRLDVARFLRPGMNRICVLVRYSAVADYLYNILAPGVWLELEGVLGTDADWSLQLCEAEWPSKVPWFSEQSGYCEWHDLRQAGTGTPVETVVLPPGHPVCQKALRLRETPMPQDRVIMPAAIPVVFRAPAVDDLLARPVAELNTHETHMVNTTCTAEIYALTSGGEHDVTIQPDDAEHEACGIVFDFDYEVSGRFVMEIEAPEGCVVDLSYEEQLWQGDRLRPDQTHTNPTYQFSDRLILKDGRNLVTTYLVDRGFRMVQMVLRNFHAPVVIHKVYALDRRYPLGKRGSFFCGDYRLNRLWDICQETLAACVTDIYTDCPWRERLFYINDMVVENMTMLTMFGDYRLTRHALELAFSEMEDDDLITSSCPGKRNSKFAVILSANIFLAVVLRDYLRYSGDVEIVRRHFPKLRRIMQRFISWIDADGLICPPSEYWNFFDWSYEENGTMFSGRKSAVMNYAFLMAARAMNELAAAVGESPLAETLLKRLEQATLQAYWSTEQQALLDGHDCAASPEQLIELGIKGERHRDNPVSRLTHALAIIADADRGGHDMDAPLCNKSLLTPDLYYLFFILKAMAHDGLYDQALDTIRTYWHDILDSGSPTIWENGVHDPGKDGFGGSASLCHGFSTGPATFLQQLVLGITPLSDGFATVRFEPEFPEIRFAKGRVPTPHGAIEVSWSCDREGHFQADLAIPEKTVCETPCGKVGTGIHHISWTK